MSQWRIQPLDKTHDRTRFDCGEEGLNAFLRQHAGQNARRDISRTYVAVPLDSKRVVGYYTLASTSLTLDLLPEEISRRLPRYPVPSALLARLAVDTRFQGRGLGRLLLVDAMKRVRDVAEQIGIFALTVHALNDRARSFYQAFGFLPLLDDPDHLYLQLATIRGM